MMSSISVKLNKVTLIYGILVSIIFCYILFNNIGDRHLYVFLIGIGLGISLYHASLVLQVDGENSLKNETVNS